MEARSQKQSPNVLNLLERMNDPSSLPVFNLKDFISYMIIVVMMIVFYFTSLKDHEVRIAVSETKHEAIMKELSEIKSEQRAMLELLRKGAK